MTLNRNGGMFLAVTGWLLLFTGTTEVCVAQLKQVASNNPLDVRVDSVMLNAQAPRSLILLTLQNRLNDRRLYDVTVEVTTKRGSKITDTPIMLDAGQIQVKRIGLPQGDAALYLVATFKRANLQNSMARAIEYPVRSSTSPLWASLLPVVGTLVGTALGAILIHLYSAKRERARAQFEWSRMLYEKSEDCYRKFLSTWNGSPNALILERQFENLQQNCFVPLNLKEAYVSTVSILSDESVPDEVKQSASKALEEKIEGFVRQPW